MDPCLVNGFIECIDTFIGRLIQLAMNPQIYTLLFNIQGPFVRNEQK